MGLWSKRIKRRTETKPAIAYEKGILAMAGMISDQNKVVRDELKECILDAETYFKTHRNVFEEWGLNHFSDERDVYRITMFHFLERGNFICTRDWKDEKEDFIDFVQGLKGYKKYNLSIEPDWLDDNGSIASWSGILDNKWKDKDCYLAAIDIEADSYVLFVCDGSIWKHLLSCAASVGYQIGLAKEM